MKSNELDKALDAVRAALEIAPGNAPLRRHYADLLVQTDRFEQAEQEYRAALKLQPEDPDTLMGLVNAFCGQGKFALALVVIEQSLFHLKDVPPRAHMLHARVLYRTERIPEAVEAYRRAVQLDPSCEDKELAANLGFGVGNTDEISEGRVRVYANDSDADDQPAPHSERPQINFGSVGGMEQLKEEIRMKIVLPLTNKDLYAAYGKKVGGGILMYGPPGCGKTHLARATAGEIQAEFISVGLHDILDMWLGQSERRLHDLFEHARSMQPCVLFFDEVDALGARRTDMRTSAGRHLINQFLAELDGIESSNEGLLILAATNAPWHLDGAFRRPGRFDRIIFVPPPDGPARTAILNIHLHGMPTKDVNLDAIAAKTHGFSGADLKGVVDIAVEDALKVAMKRGRPEPLTTNTLLDAARKMNASTKEWFSTARNHAIYANEGGMYDAILAYTKGKPA